MSIRDLISKVQSTEWYLREGSALAEQKYEEGWIANILQEAYNQVSGNYQHQCNVSVSAPNINIAMRFLYLKTKGLLTLELNKIAARSRPKLSCLEKQIRGERSVYADFALYQLGKMGYATMSSLYSQRNLAALADKVNEMVIPANSSRAWMQGEQVLKHNEVLEFISDPTIWYIAQEYLNCQPILNEVQLWKSEPFNEALHNKSKDALEWHFDHDHNRFLLFLIYLSDVKLSNGPHQCIPKSSFENMPSFMTYDGRYEDVVIERSGCKSLAFTGGMGDIIVADTINLHRGLPVNEGRRLVMQLRFVDSTGFTPRDDFNIYGKLQRELLYA